MKYANAKKALSLMIIFTVLELAGSFVGSLLNLDIITLITEVVVGIAFLAAYFIGSRDSQNFNMAKTYEVFDILATIATIIFAIIANTAAWADSASSVLKLVDRIVDVMVFYYVCSACAEVAEEEKITKAAHTTFVWYTVSIVLTAAATLVLLFNSVATAIIASAAAIVAAVACIVAGILQFILIIRAHKHCK